MAAGVASSWQNSDRHVDVEIDPNSFASSARFMIYASAGNPGDTSATGVTPIGLLQSFQESSQRQVIPVSELGSDLPYLVTGPSRGSLSLSRVLLAKKNLITALYGDGTQYVSLDQLTKPCNIVIAPYSRDEGASLLGGVVFLEAYFTATGSSASVGQVVLMEQGSLLYTNKKPL